MISVAYSCPYDCYKRELILYIAGYSLSRIKRKENEKKRETNFKTWWSARNMVKGSRVASKSYFLLLKILKMQPPHNVTKFSRLNCGRIFNYLNRFLKILFRDLVGSNASMSNIKLGVFVYTWAMRSRHTATWLFKPGHVGRLLRLPIGLPQLNCQSMLQILRSNTSRSFVRSCCC